MYAIVATGGKQYKVAKDDILDVEKIDAEAGSKVKLDVLMLGDGAKTVVDPAKLKGKQVTAEVLEHFKGEKVLVFKLKKRKRYHRTRGHRQQLTRIKITALPSAGRASSKKAAEDESD